MTSAAAAEDSATATVDLKVVLLGQHYVGKTALMERFLHERFLSADGYQTTIGAAYGSKRVCVKSHQHQALPAKSVVLGVWDTAGGEHYQSLARIYYRGARAAILCYDVTAADSLARAEFWANELAKYEPACRVYVCGCKLDLVVGNPASRTVSPVAVRKFANDLGATVFETSSKTGENVVELFSTIAEEYVRGAVVSGDASSPTGAVSLHQHQHEKQQKQCGC